MQQVKILLADNDADFLQTRREFLEREGYSVVSASSPAEVQEILRQSKPALAILDIRLLNDDDEKDKSGIELGKQIGSEVPVILLTGYPSLEYARQVMRPQSDGSPVTYDFITKQEGPEAMLTAVRNVLTIRQTPRMTTLWRGILRCRRFGVLAALSLLLALGSGVLAALLSDPRWLFGAIAIAILFIVLIAFSLEQGE